MTKTLRPVLRLPDAPVLAELVLDEPADVAAGLDAAADVAAGADELDELELHAAARPTVAITGSARASFLARLRFISLNPFNSVADAVVVRWTRCGGLVAVAAGWSLS
jgi:hypothetical protein